MSIEKEMKLSAKDWKELHEGLRFNRKYLREFPNGIKDAMNLAKEGAKEQISTSVLALLSPLTNEIDQLFADITSQLGLQEAVNIVSNSILDVISSFSFFISKLLNTIFDAEIANRNTENLKGWMELFNPWIYFVVGLAGRILAPGAWYPTFPPLDPLEFGGG